MNKTLITISLITIAGCAPRATDTTETASTSGTETTTETTASEPGAASAPESTHIVPVYHCQQSDMCREYPTLAGAALENAQYGCTQFRGTWADGGCATENVAGTCYMTDQTEIYYTGATGLASGQDRCGWNAQNQWVAGQ